MFSYRKIDSFSFFILILAVFSYLPVSSKRASPSPANSLPQLADDHFLSEIKKITASYRRCLLDQLFYIEEIWKHIPSAIEACTVGKFWQSLDVHTVKMPPLAVNYHFIPPKPITSPCVAVRMNIGLDGRRGGLLPEETLRGIMPQCKFFGTASEDDINYSSIGKFYKKLSSFMEPPDHMFDIGNGVHVSYAKNPLYPISVKEKTFLERYIKLPRIDYLWIHTGLASATETKDGTTAFIPNTCYHEFSILQHPINVTVCQVTVSATMINFHSNGIDVMRLARPTFKPLFISLLSKSALLPIRGKYISTNGLYGFLHLFYVNMSNPYCAKKYLAVCDDDECQANDNFYED